MRKVMEETRRRRELQTRYNIENNVNPETIRKTMEEIMHSTAIADLKTRRDDRIAERQKPRMVAEPVLRFMTSEQKRELLEQLQREMMEAAKDLEFERAAQLRDEIQRISGQSAA
jgi:excinuclease ABC subunit B